MDNKISRGKEFIAEKLELPKDVVLDLPKIIIVGRNELILKKVH